MIMWWNIFCSDTKISEEWKENLCISQESFKNFIMSFNFRYKVTPPDFKIQYLWKNKSLQPYYQADEGQISGFYLSNFVYNCFPPKIQFPYSFLSSLSMWGAPMVGTKGNIFWNLGLQIPAKCILTLFPTFLHAFFLTRSDFSWNFRVLCGVLKKIWLERYITFFICFCNCLNQRKCKKNRWIEWKIF